MVEMKRDLTWFCHALVFFMLYALCGGVVRNPEHPSLPLIFQPQSISILSVQFNPEAGMQSDWVIPLFGDKAVFHNRSYDSRLRSKLQPREFTEREEMFKSYFKLPEHVLSASCSLELFGFVPVNTHRPFTWGDKEYRPSVGTASLLVNESDEWTCYYRALYENPLHSLSQYRHQHWPIVFLCPAPNQRTSCANALAASDQAKQAGKKLPLRLSIQFIQDQWSVDVPVDLQAITKAKGRQSKAALCTAIPYTSSKDERLDANGAMLYEFIRYHSELDMKVIVFDRKGANWDTLTSNVYRQRGQGIDSLDLEYYNYTVLDGLQSYRSKNVKAESDEGLSAAIVLTDFDKRFTLTYCRFVAKVIHGIDKVLVLDFDEFLYCPSAPPTKDGQRKFVAKHLASMQAKKIEQYVMRQRVLVSRYDDMQACLLRQVQAGKQAVLAYHKSPDKQVQQQIRDASIFQCLAAYRFLVRRNFDKSFHLGHYCPYTSFHHSSNLRHFDCIASSQRDFDRGCSAIHFTTKPPNYNRTHEHNMEDVRIEPNELFLVTNTFPSPVLADESKETATINTIIDMSLRKEEVLKERRAQKRMKRIGGQQQGG